MAPVNTTKPQKMETETSQKNKYNNNKKLFQYHGNRNFSNSHNHYRGSTDRVWPVDSDGVKSVDEHHWPVDSDGIKTEEQVRLRPNNGSE